MDAIIERLEKLERLIVNQGLNTKSVLTFNEASEYLGLSHSHLYKLTSADEVPYYKPNGKKLYFKREELDRWLLRNRNVTSQEMHDQTADYLNNKGRVGS